MHNIKRKFLIEYLHQNIFKHAFQAGFSVHNNHLNLFGGQVENLKWILYTRKICVNCGFLSFFVIQIVFNETR